MDTGGDGTVDKDELDAMIQVIDSKNKDVSKIINTLSGITSGNDKCKTTITEISQKTFIKAFTEKDFGNTEIGKKMIRWIQLQRIRSTMLSGALLILFLLHAPISQRIFHYFVCHDISGQHYLKVDYGLNCNEEKYLSFRIVPIVMLLIFTAGFPIIIFMMLFINRKQLQTVSVRAQLGFLYSSFRPNAGEFWEVHELLRKLMLMGALVLIESTKLRMVVALLVCVVSTASLNYYKPHQNPIVLMVSQASFLLTTFKYILAIILLDVTDEQRTILGGVLIFLDVCFVLGSFLSVVAVLYLLSKHVKEHQQRPPLTAVKPKKYIWDSTLVKKAVAKQKTHLLMDNAEAAAKSHLVKLIRRKSAAKLKLEKRLVERVPGLNVKKKNKKKVAAEI